MRPAGQTLPGQADAGQAGDIHRDGAHIGGVPLHRVVAFFTQLESGGGVDRRDDGVALFKKPPCQLQKILRLCR